MSNFSVSNEVERLLWKGYCGFHGKDFESAQEIYIKLLSGNYNDVPEETTLYLACVYYSMQLYSEAMEAAMEGPDCALKHRILYHSSYKLEDDQETVLSHRQMLGESEEDQLSLAAILFEQSNFQQVCEIYKRMLSEDRKKLALNMYVAMCYFKMVSVWISSKNLELCRMTNI